MILILFVIQNMQEIQATKQHCRLCFETLLSTLNNKQSPIWPASIPDAKSPIFVTWKIKGYLRGCIGTFSPGIHSKLVPQYGVTAALKDPRFKPMTLAQINNDLIVYVSLLINFEEVSDMFDWQVGKHGIIIKADYKGEYYSATFLPEVASQQKWDKQTTISHLLRKADYEGQFDQIKQHIKLTRYQSSKANLSYEEYLTMLKP